MPLFRRTCVCLAALLYALPAFAQDREFRGPWEPFGPVPVDQAPPPVLPPPLPLPPGSAPPAQSSRASVPAVNPQAQSADPIFQGREFLRWPGNK